LLDLARPRESHFLRKFVHKPPRVLHTHKGIVILNTTRLIVSNLGWGRSA